MKALESRPETYNRTVREIGEMERAGEVFVIRPEAALKIKRVEHDRAKIQAVYDQGRAVARKRLPALREFLRKEGKAT